MDTPPKIFGQRLRALIEGKGYSFDAFAKEVGISRATLYNWFDRDEPPPNKSLRDELVRVLEEPAEYILRGETGSKKTVHLKSGHVPASARSAESATNQPVASRIPPEQRKPATQAECEAYFADLLVRAAQSEDPNAFPYLLRRLMKEFPLSEWE